MESPSQELQAGDSHTRRDRWIALLLGALCLLVYNANMRVIGSADSYSTRFLPFALLQYHTVTLDPILTVTAQGRRVGGLPGKNSAPDEWMYRPYWVLQSPLGNTVSMYPIAVPILVAPLYAPAVLYLNWKGWEQWRVDWVARIMEKAAASVIASLSVALFYILLRRRAGVRLALLLSFAYAFGTGTWMTGSQALWQHGMTELLLIGMLLAVTGPSTPRAALVAGLLCGLIACNRPPDSLLAGAAGLYGLFWAGRKIPWLVGGALVPVSLLFVYNLGIVGHWAGGYGLIAYKDFFIFNPALGALGLLFSPVRGLFFYSPFLLFVPLFATRIWREREGRFLSVAMGVAVVLLIASYARVDWTQGYCWGARYLTSAVPALIWMLPPVLQSLSWVGRSLFLAACLPAVALQVIGAFWYAGASDALLFGNAPTHLAMSAAWNLRNTSAWVELQHPPVTPEMTTLAQGSIDIATTVEGAALSAADGRDLLLQGWALADGRTPTEILIRLDGAFVATTGAFFPRPDVMAELDIPFACGWRVKLPARPLDPGHHVLSVFVRSIAGGEGFYVAETKFVVPEPMVPGPRFSNAPPVSEQTMAARARKAAELIVARQDALGYWLTAFTKRPTYQIQGQELNTYLNALMIDLLEPVAKEAKLEGNVSRVKQFLTTQIEEGGLVRYHGRPDAPTIGRLGCAITPDSDDTALVWRVAPASDRQPLRSALTTIRGYQTPSRLYQTWLSPRAGYQCLDPGSDPNPADATIQMHIFLLLAKEDPPSARALCQSLGKRMVSDDLFVYYRNAPIVPLMRQADLQNAGCKIDLPAAIFDRTAEGQDEWIAAARLLQQFLRKPATPPNSVEVSRVLGALSHEDFARMRYYPPLLYHNDLTATVNRFYWSEDIGYALWLRLYVENERAKGRKGAP